LFHTHLRFRPCSPARYRRHNRPLVSGAYLTALAVPARVQQQTHFCASPASARRHHPRALLRCISADSITESQDLPRPSYRNPVPAYVSLNTAPACYPPYPSAHYNSISSLSCLLLHSEGTV
jgi:hypothetical protein